MSADVNEVCRLLEDLDIDHEVAQNGHEVRWRDADGVRWAFFGSLYSGRVTRLCAYDVTPETAVAASIASHRLAP